MVGQIGRRPRQIQGGVDQDDVAKNADPLFVPPLAEKGDNLLKKNPVKKNAGSFFRNELAAVLP